LARKDDSRLADHPPQDAEIKDARALSPHARSPFLMKLFVIFALLLTLAWSAWLGWTLVRAGLSLLDSFTHAAGEAAQR
jgi:hypothetical protein